MNSFASSLKVLDKWAKEKRAFKKAIGQKSELRELWYNCGLKVKAESGHLLFPLVLKQTPREYGQDWLLHLPVGLSEINLRSKAHKLAAALGGSIQIERVNGEFLMRIMNGEIKRRYDFHLVDRGGMGIPVPIGYGWPGLVTLDLATAPHLLVGGTPGFGKSVFLQQAVATMIYYGTQVYIIDLKRLDFSDFKPFIRIVKSEIKAINLLETLCKEMERRFDILENMNLKKIQDYQGTDLPYIAVIIDELAELQADEFFNALNRLLRLCRAVGISIIAATQRPSTEVIDGDSRAMFTARLCYQVADELNSRMILGETHSEAAYLPAIPGRGIYRFGNTFQEVQTMIITETQTRELMAELPTQSVPPEPEPEIITIT